MSRSTPCFVAFCAASILIAGCSHSAPDRVASGSAGASTTVSTSSTTAPASVTALADRLARAIPDDVVQCAALNELRIHHKELSDPGVHVDLERPEGTFEGRVRGLAVLLGDHRFDGVPWSEATLLDVRWQDDPAGVGLTLGFARPVTVPTGLGVPDDLEGAGTTTTDRRGHGQTRPVTPEEAQDFAAATEVQVGVDLQAGVVAVVQVPHDRTMCRIDDGVGVGR